MSTVKNEAALTAKIPEVQGIMDQIDQADNSLEVALRIALDCRAKADDLEAQYDNARKASAIAEQMVMEKMIEQGVDRFRALGKSITRSETVRPSVLAEDRPKQIEWLREIGAGALVTETVNAQSFGALVRNDYIKAEREADLPEFVKVYREPKLLVRSV